MDMHPVKVTLTVVEGLDFGLTLMLDHFPVTLGRKHSDFRLQDRGVSQTHARITIEGDHVFIEDLTSANGTYVNEIKLEQKQSLKNLDTLLIGATKIRVNIVVDLNYFKSNNSNAFIDEKTIQNEDIASLIQDELKRFSKWDLANPPMEALVKADNADFPYALVVRSGIDKGKQYVFQNSRMTIGRGSTDCVLKDTDVSRVHAAIEILEGNRLVLSDLKSSNGVFVNGIKITQLEIKEGDLITIGKTICTFIKLDDE